MEDSIAAMHDDLVRRLEPRPGERWLDVDWGTEAHVRELLGHAFELESFEGDAPETAESGEALWEFNLAGVGPLKLLYDSLDPEQRGEFHRASVEMYEHDRGADGIHRERLYLLTIGRRT